MKTTGTTLRPSFVSTHAVPVAFASGIVALGLVLAGVIWFQSSERAARPETAALPQPALVYDATGAMQAALGPSAAEAASVRPAPVYDATGAMLDAVEAGSALAASGGASIYDATGAMLAALSASDDAANQAPLPVYDATSAMWLAVPSLKP